MITSRRRSVCFAILHVGRFGWFETQQCLPVHLQVTHGELNEVPLETLSAVAQNVFLPLLTSTGNQEGWPDVVAREVTDNLHRFVANSKC
jgi:hypothetical protein